MYKSLFLIVLLGLLVRCSDQKNHLFSKLNSEQTGVTFKNSLYSSPELNILNYLYYYNGAGVITADFNNDGFIDLYCAANQAEDKLYLNRGNFKFEEVALPNNLIQQGNWTTGVTQVDINNDGLLDIYICKASGYRALTGRNLLYVNQGINKDGIPSFKEQAEEFGLAFSGLSTKAAFFDYDKDGDLDMFLLNHSVHPNINYGKGKQRKIIDSISGDRLYTNNNGYFEDTSAASGIFQGKSGYGLGLSISDLNNDGYPDIYVGNDFFENDYLYINQKDGTFKEITSQDDTILGHTTHYSMGNAIADINNDSYPDIVSLDMLPEDLHTYKTSGLEYAFPIYQQYLRNGYAPQYMQNTLHLNNEGKNFSEIGNLSGISATEWSWGSLLADFDNDGYKDLFVSNGIKGATNDMDYMNFIANDEIQKRIDAGMEDTDMPLINEIPEKKVSNYFFKNNKDLSFTNVTDKWSNLGPSFSNGCTYADLDNDGDLDIIVNNIDEELYILKNNLTNSNYLSISLKGPTHNIFGIGAKINLYTKNGKQTLEHFTTNGYLSSSSNKLHFGLGSARSIDSLTIVWPDNKRQSIKNPEINKEITLEYRNSTLPNKKTPIESTNALTETAAYLNFIHRERPSLDFSKEPLIPYANSNEGPTISIADINNDGLDDIFIGGAKAQPSKLFLQDSNDLFVETQTELFENDAINEDTCSIFFDANGDGFIDLLVASGGNEFLNGKPLQPRLYINKNGNFIKDTLAFNHIELNASKISYNDFDKDGDYDVVISADQKPTAYGITPDQYFFINDGKGIFTNQIEKVAPQLKSLGNIKDMVWTDINKDGYDDLIVVGHWMPISIFLNNGKQLILQTNNLLNDTNGWWNTILVADLNNDGHKDLVCGNWGLNTKFKASKAKPITLYNYDFDENGQIDPIITYYHKDTETAFASKDELVKQLPYLNKKFLSYSTFAEANIDELFGQSSLKNAERKQVNELQSCWFKNDGTGKFSKHLLPKIAQISTINDMVANDFNSDGFDDLLIVGNNFEISTQLGRLDALHGLILYNTKDTITPFNNLYKMLQINGASREVHKIKIKGNNIYMVGRNNNSPYFYNYHD
ncbi:VCBS repeat-containing protein [Maribacter sp. LLG6340-A2]|uniref:VCBS repeat-containing protein n=1 Tax=Maribacter sp. LLG6340-A2 TaxID=3160834 RepID=UPI00386B8BED